MLPIQHTFFTITLYLALVALLKWKIRRDERVLRVNRNLKGYVAGACAACSSDDRQTELQGKDLVTI
jgi:hypothetical protein